MATKFLFPHRFKVLGWILLVPSAIVGALTLGGFQLGALDVRMPALVTDAPASGGFFFQFTNNNITDELSSVLFIAGAFMAAFSRHRREDEYIASLRLDALMWATYFNYAVLVLALVFIYGFSFLTVLCLNMFSILVVFLARFNYLLYRHKFLQ